MKRLKFGLFFSLIALAGCVGETLVPAVPNSNTVRGAGATFPAPLYQKWVELYQIEFSDQAVVYESVGSGEGTKRFLDETVDFGASDAALTDEQIDSVDRGALLIPMTAGSIAIAYNRTGLPDGLRLSRDVYVDIFLGKIKYWNDKRIKELNPEANLPLQHIVVVQRSDSSGTTFAFTSHLAEASQQWKEGPGVGKFIEWPTSGGVGRGNDGQAGAIKMTPGAIGYIQYGIAKYAGLGMAALENKAGNYIQPTGESGLKTLTNTPLPENLRAFFPDPEGEESYPIVTLTWMLVYQKYDDPQKADAVKQFLTWCLSEGQQYNESLGYLRLAPDQLAAAQAAVDSVQ